MRTMFFILAVIGMFLYSLLLVGDRTSSSTLTELKMSMSRITFRIPRTEIPRDVVTTVVSVRVNGRVWRDSVNTATMLSDTAILNAQIPHGIAEIAIRGKKRNGNVAYAGIFYSEIEEDERVAGLRFNPISERTEKAQVRLDWDSDADMWKFSMNNPVIQTSEARSGVQPDYYAFPTVIRAKSTYMMWYTTGFNEYTSGIDSIWTEYATSTNGEQWSGHGRIQISGQKPNWVKKSFILLCILYEDGMYKAWFEGLKEHWTSTGIGYAESVDGITWNLDDATVVASSPERPNVCEASIYKHSGSYHLYYTAFRSDDPILKREVYLSTSKDGKRWEDRGCILRGRPDVLWEKFGVMKPAIFSWQDTLRMYYTTWYEASGGVTMSCIGEARSTDGIFWRQIGEDPILAPSGRVPWMTTSVSSPTIDITQNRLRIWFAAYSKGSAQWSIGFAERDLARSN